MKLNNVTKSITTNPLFGVIMALVLLLVALAIIRIFQPSFSMGAEIGGHVGTLEGNLKLEAYKNEHFNNCKNKECDDGNCDGFENKDDYMNQGGMMNESYMNHSDMMNESYMNHNGMMNGSHMNHIGTEAENESFIPAPSPFPNIQ